MAGVKAAMISSTFDHELKDNKKDKLLLNLAIDTLGWYQGIATCREQYLTQLDENWYDHFDNHIVIQAEEEEEESHLAKRAMKGLKIVTSLQKFNYYKDSNLYHFQKAFYSTFALANIFVLSLDLAGSDIIKVQNRWVRYYDI